MINNNSIYKLKIDGDIILFNEYIIFSWNYKSAQDYECNICNIYISQSIRFHKGSYYYISTSDIRICLNCYKKLHILATARTI